MTLCVRGALTREDGAGLREAVDLSVAADAALASAHRPGVVVRVDVTAAGAAPPPLAHRRRCQE